MLDVTASGMICPLYYIRVRLKLTLPSSFVDLTYYLNLFLYFKYK